MSSLGLFEVLVVLAILAPLVALAVIGLWLLLRPEHTPERAVVRISAVSLSTSFVACAVAAGIATFGDVSAVVARVRWFSVGAHSFELGVLADTPALVMMVLVSSVTGLIGRFSVYYLHRDRGFARFFVLLNLFSFGMLMLVTSASIDQLFLGWEVVGVTSSLLVGYFHLRRAPVEAGVRVFSTYRVCDVGFLFGAVLMHLYAGSTDFVASEAGAAHAGVSTMTTSQATAVGLCFLVGAIGKAAQLPTGGWLPRAMEGPTPSSALFYGALSVHAGVFLLIRAYPVLAAAPLAAGAVIAIGTLTALYASLVVRAQSDAKTTLAYATMAQVGLLFVEVGLGFTTLALVHLVAHVCLRAFQLLRTPSALADAFTLRAALGESAALPSSSPPAAPSRLRVLAYRLAIERLFVDTVLQRSFVAPLLALGDVLSSLEHRVMDVIAGPQDAHATLPPLPPLEARELPHAADRS